MTYHWKDIWIYLLKFAAVFAFVYLGSMAIIGLSAKGGKYSSFVHTYLDFISWLRFSLVHVPGRILSEFGYVTYPAENFTLKVKNGYGVRIEYDCVGYGVMSFWIAFVVANKGTWLKKLKWVIGGLFLIWFINVIRISMVLVAANRHWKFPLGMDHHTWFTIVAYAIIFVMIYFYDRTSRKITPSEKTSYKPHQQNV